MIPGIPDSTSNVPGLRPQTPKQMDQNGRLLPRAPLGGDWQVQPIVDNWGSIDGHPALDGQANGLEAHPTYATGPYMPQGDTSSAALPPSPIKQAQDPSQLQHSLESSDDVYSHFSILSNIHPIVAGVADALAANSNQQNMERTLLNSAWQDGKTPGQTLIEMQQGARALENAAQGAPQGQVQPGGTGVDAYQPKTSMQTLQDQRNDIANRLSSNALPMVDTRALDNAQNELNKHLMTSPEVPILKSPEISDMTKATLLLSGLIGGFNKIGPALQSVWKQTVEFTQQQNQLTQQQYGLNHQKYEDRTKALQNIVATEMRRIQTTETNNTRNFNAEQGRLMGMLNGIDKQISQESKGFADELVNANKTFQNMFVKQGVWDQSAQDRFQAWASDFSRRSGMPVQSVLANVMVPSVGDKTEKAKQFAMNWLRQTWRTTIENLWKKGEITDADVQDLQKKQAQYATDYGLSPEQGDAYFPIPSAGLSPAKQTVLARERFRIENFAMKSYHEALASRYRNGNIEQSDLDYLDSVRDAIIAKAAEQGVQLDPASFARPKLGLTWQAVMAGNKQKLAEANFKLDQFKTLQTMGNAEFDQAYKTWKDAHKTNFEVPFQNADKAWNAAKEAVTKARTKAMSMNPNDKGYQEAQTAAAAAVQEEVRLRKERDKALSAMHDDEKDAPKRDSYLTPGNPFEDTNLGGNPFDDTKPWSGTSGTLPKAQAAPDSGPIGQGAKSSPKASSQQPSKKPQPQQSKGPEPKATEKQYKQKAGPPAPTAPKKPSGNSVTSSSGVTYKRP